MIQTIQTKDIDLRFLIDRFGIQLVEDEEFFREWRENLPEISESDKRLLDKVKAGYINLLNYPQILAYMLANPSPDKPSYGAIATGGSFIFVKLVLGNPPRYSLSKGFLTRNPGNELYDVLRILKSLSQIARDSRPTFPGRAKHPEREIVDG